MQFILIRGTFLWYCTRPVPKPWRAPMREAVTKRRFRRLPDRRYLERKILPWLARESGPQPHILSIGCQVMTAHYERLLARRGAHYSTVDIDPEASRFGARHHLVKSVTDLAPPDFPTPVDAVLFNGVIGWGLDEPKDLEAAFAALAALLQPGSHLILGWNTDRRIDPIADIDNATALFSVCPGPTDEKRVTFPGVTSPGSYHVYDFLRRK
jgi:SAM-dependent methyltransferase